MACAALLLGCATAQAAATWTLESSIERAVAVAPELEMKAAAMRAQQAATRQAGAWPNPSMEIRADNRLARELGDNGYEVTELAISQPLAWGVSKARRAVAERELAVHESAARSERLDLERRVAVAYHRLQREQALLALARQALDETRRLAAPEARRLALGDISRREAMRMELLASQAEVALADAEGEWEEARLTFAALLALDPADIGELPPLAAIDAAPDLAVLERALEDHPAIADTRARRAVHEAGIDLARAEGRPAFSVTVFRERDVFAGREEVVNGGTLNVEIPLWDRRGGKRDELGAQALGEQQRGFAVRRELAVTLGATHVHLLHLIEQTRHQAQAVLAPAREIHALTRRGYQAGEIDLTTLIEARDTAIDAEMRQQQLRADTLLTLAEMRHAAGLPLSSGTPDSPLPQ
jgi:cobalt-zinc-cadmium efflux system outer membrane protein